MFCLQEDELDPTDQSNSSTDQTTENMDVDMSDANSRPDFLVQSSLNTKKTNYSSEKSDLVDDDDDEHKDSSRIRLCKICGKDFKSDKALGGHLRIHSHRRQHQHRAKRSSRKRSNKPATRKQYSSPEPDDDDDDDDDEDDGFACFVCDDSLSTMKLLCEHMRKHRDSNIGIIHQRQQPLIPSGESRSEAEAEVEKEEETETVFEQAGINETETISPRSDDLVITKDIPKWSQTRKRGWQKTSTTVGEHKRLEEQDSSKEYFQPKKKHKILSKSNHQDSSIIQSTEFGPAADHTHDNTLLEVLGKQPETNKVPMLPVSNKSGPIIMRLKMNSNNSGKAAKTVVQQQHLHQCEICGRTFQTGQALGGHKTYHRMKQAMPKLDVQRKPQDENQYLCGKTSSQVITEYVTTMLLSSAHPNSTQQPRLLDFDLNIPYQE